MTLGLQANNLYRVHADSSPDAFDDPKVETIVEIFHRIWVRSHRSRLRHLAHFMEFLANKSCRMVPGELFLLPFWQMPHQLLSAATHDAAPSTARSSTKPSTA